MSEPAVVVVFAPSGYGKTVDALYTAATAPFFTPAPGGLTPARALLGFMPLEIRVNSIAQATGAIRAYVQKNGKPPALVLDDFSITAERSHYALDKAGMKGWGVWQKLARDVMDLRELALDLGVTLIITCHEAQPKTADSGVFTAGGPKMPSAAMIATLPHVATLVLRGVKDAFVQPPEWSGAYSCDPSDGRWVTKDRYCVVPKTAPMNVREILGQARRIGHDVIVPPRAKGLEWLDVVAEQIADGLTAGIWPSPAFAAQALAANARSLPSQDPRHLRWAWRDGCARHKLRSAGASQELFGMFSPPPAA